MIRRPPRSTQSRSSAASDVYKRQIVDKIIIFIVNETKINNDISFNKIKEKYYYKLFLIHENKINNLIKELNPNINFNINGKVYSLITKSQFG